MPKVIIFGASTLAEMAQYYFTHDSNFSVVAYTVDGEYMDRDTMSGLPVVPFEEVKDSFSPSDHQMFIAIGPHGVNQVRALKCEKARAMGYRLASYVCSKASVWPDLKVGENTFIDQGTIVHPLVHIGNNVVLISAGIAHHCILNDHSYIVAATLGGGVHVGEYSFIGMNATVREHVSIGRSCIIGAGTTVLHDTKENEVFRAQETPAARAPSYRVNVMPASKKKE